VWWVRVDGLVDGCIQVSLTSLLSVADPRPHQGCVPRPCGRDDRPDRVGGEGGPGRHRHSGNGQAPSDNPGECERLRRPPLSLSSRRLPQSKAIEMNYVMVK